MCRFSRVPRVRGADMTIRRSSRVARTLRLIASVWSIASLLVVVLRVARGDLSSVWMSVSFIQYHTKTSQNTPVS